MHTDRLCANEYATRAIALDDCDPSGRVALGYRAMMERQTAASLAAPRRALPGGERAHQAAELCARYLDAMRKAGLREAR